MKSFFRSTEKYSNLSSAVLQRIFKKYNSGKLLLPKYTDMRVPQDVIRSYHYITFCFCVDWDVSIYQASKQVLRHICQAHNSWFFRSEEVLKSNFLWALATFVNRNTTKRSKKKQTCTITFCLVLIRTCTKEV